MNLTHSDLMIQTPLGKKIGVVAAGRTSYLHAFRSPTFNAFSRKVFEGSSQDDILSGPDPDEEEDSYQVDADMRYQDVNLKLIYQPTLKDYISISSILSFDSFDYYAQDNAEESIISRIHEVSYRGINLFYKHEWDSSWSSSISYSQASYALNNDSREFFDEDDESQIRISNSLKTHELKTGLSYQVDSSTSLGFGYQFNLFENDFNYEEISTFEGAITDGNIVAANVHGLYAEYKKWSFDNWSISPQVRMDYYEHIDQLVVNPVINGQLKLSDGVWSKASYGHYSQLLRLLSESDLNVSNISENVWLVSDEDSDLDLLRSRQLTLGGVYKKKGYLIDLDFYKKRTFGASLIDQFSGAENDLDFESGQTESMGLDLMVRKKFGRYQLWTSYSLSRTMNKFEELSASDFFSSLDRPHQLRLVQTYYHNQLEFSLGFILKSGAPYTTAIGYREIDPIEEEYEIQYGSINANRLDVYHRLDLSVWYRFPKKESPRFKGMLGFSILNVYDQENVWRRFYVLEDDNDDGVPELTQEDRFYLGFTPNLTLKIQFK